MQEQYAALQETSSLGRVTSIVTLTAQWIVKITDNLRLMFIMYVIQKQLMKIAYSSNKKNNKKIYKRNYIEYLYIKFYIFKLIHLKN